MSDYADAYRVLAARTDDLKFPFERLALYFRWTPSVLTVSNSECEVRPLGYWRTVCQQLAFDQRKLSVNYSIQVQLSTACEGEVLRRVRQ